MSDCFSILRLALRPALGLIAASLFMSPVAVGEPLPTAAGDMQRRLQIVTQIQQLQAELRELRGSLEQNNQDVSDLKRRQREFYLDLDRRLIELESNPAPTGQGQAAVPVAPLAGDGSPANLKAQEQAAYQQAFDLLKAAKYDESVASFQQFLQLYPAGDYADNARYWVGEAYYVTRNFDKALAEFDRLLQLHPASDKRADTELKIAYIYYEQQKWKQARDLLTKIAADSEAGTAARLATTRLSRMTEEGR